MDDIIGLTADNLTIHLVELIRRTSTVLPEDVVAKIRYYRDKEDAGSRAARTLNAILRNIDMAESGSRPMCQDSGTVTFDIHYPFGLRQSELLETIQSAARIATEKNYLRPNVVDPVTGIPKPDNVGRGHPAIYFDQWDKDYMEVMLVLKGGGCENVGAQYSLPYTPLNAGRDMDGIKKVALDAVAKAQGKGCSPGVLGIGIGGDRAQGYVLGKKQLHRKLDDVNPDPQLRELEEWLVENSNTLGIGPMGFGGRTTLLGAKAAVMDSIPASFFVSVVYMCWAYRRRKMIILGGEVEYD